MHVMCGYRDRNEQRVVEIDGLPLSPGDIPHADLQLPGRFGWGDLSMESYALAFAVLWHFAGKIYATAWYRVFTEEVVSKWHTGPADTWSICAHDAVAWISAHEIAVDRLHYRGKDA